MDEEINNKETFERLFIQENTDDDGYAVLSFSKERQYKTDKEYISKQLHDKCIKETKKAEVMKYQTCMSKNLKVLEDKDKQIADLENKQEAINLLVKEQANKIAELQAENIKIKEMYNLVRANDTKVEEELKKEIEKLKDKTCNKLSFCRFKGSDNKC